MCEEHTTQNLTNIIVSNPRCTYLEDERINDNTCGTCRFLHTIAVTANDVRFVVNKVYVIDQKEYVVVLCDSAEDLLRRVQISNYDVAKMFIPVLFGFQCTRYYAMQRNYTQAASIRKNGKMVAKFLATVPRSNRKITNSHIKYANKRYYLDPRGFSAQLTRPSSALMTYLIIDYINTHTSKVDIIGSYFIDKHVILSAMTQIENQGRITDCRPFLDAELII